MINEIVVLLIKVLVKEKKALNKLLELLDKQYELLMNKDIFGLEEVVEKIQHCNKEVAEIEIERRKLLGNFTITDVLKNTEDIELDNVYREIKKVLNAIQLQKDTNELLLKQQLSLTNRLLTIINPNREVPVYNSYGNINR